MSATMAKTQRVLIVDDNQDAARTLAVLLEAAGYEVEACFDGPAALAAADRFDPHACVLDINMPGMDGYELARQLRAKSPERPPVLATVTGYGDTIHLDRAADAGFDLHFTKPADPAEVAAQLPRLHGTLNRASRSTAVGLTRFPFATLSRCGGQG